jgi:integrase/recombinase XerD
LDALITKFESYLLTEKRSSHNTISSYISDINQFACYLKDHGVTRFENAQPDHLKAFIRSLHDNACKSRTKARKISSIRSFFVYISRIGATKNITENIEFPKLEKALPKFLSEDEVQQLLSVANQDSSLIGKRNKIMLYLLYVSGMRISELVALHSEDLLFDSGHVLVRGKGEKERLIPLPQSIMHILRVYTQKTLPFLLEKNKRVYNANTQHYLFPTCYGKKIKPISRQSFWYALKHFCHKANIQRTISPHQLRHSLATHLLKHGSDLRSLQLILGHENLATVEIYTHVETSYLREIYDKNHPRSDD